MYEILKTIQGPEDVKRLSIPELKQLAADIRDALMNKLSKHGGHFGPNFGMVEAEIAMHYVFNSPEDKFVFDVSHQTYPHKMLTGRARAYMEEAAFDEVSGFTNPEESAHDFFNVGHTSTGVSLASGLAVGRNLLGGKENIIAVVGDGSLSGGEALEALDYAGAELKGNFIIVVNDNQQSIAELHGGLYQSLTALRESNGTSENNIFRGFGLDYVYEAEGNDVERMIAAFRKVKDIDHPVVLHINTVKGKGYKLAEENREAWHYAIPFDVESGEPTLEFPGEYYEEVTAEFIRQKTREDSSFITITPAMPEVVGLTPEIRKELGSQYTDVGIAEEHAVAMASGIAARGGKPLVVTNATFLQRSYDQISQDICINKYPVTLLLNYASVEGMTDVTHLGIYALPEFANIPNLVVLAPTSKQEYLNMLSWSIEQKEHPVMVLIPGNGVIEDDRQPETDYSELNRFKVEKKGSKVAILALGGFYQMGEEAAKLIEEKTGIAPTLINPRFASGLDTELLEELKKAHELVITLEDGILDGGFGQKIAAYYGDSEVKVRTYGLPKAFYDRYDASELLQSLGITAEDIAAAV